MDNNQFFYDVDYKLSNPIEKWEALCDRLSFDDEFDHYKMNMEYNYFIRLYGTKLKLSHFVPEANGKPLIRPQNITDKLGVGEYYKLKRHYLKKARSNIFNNFDVSESEDGIQCVKHNSMPVTVAWYDKITDTWSLSKGLTHVISLCNLGCGELTLRSNWKTTLFN